MSALRMPLHADLVVKNFLSLFSLGFNFLQREILNAHSTKIVVWIVQLQSNFSIGQIYIEEVCLQVKDIG